jgi:hypothetical protein
MEKALDIINTQPRSMIGHACSTRGASDLFTLRRWAHSPCSSSSTNHDDVFGVLSGPIPILGELGSLVNLQSLVFLLTHSHRDLYLVHMNKLTVPIPPELRSSPVCLQAGGHTFNSSQEDRYTNCSSIGEVPDRGPRCGRRTRAAAPDTCAVGQPAHGHHCTA